MAPRQSTVDPPGRRALAATWLPVVLLPLLCLLVLALRVTPEFERVRARVLTADLVVSASGTDIDFLAPPELEPGPAAIVLRFTGGPLPARVEIAADGRVVRVFDLDAGESRRVDITVPLSPGARHRLRVAGTSPGWRLSYVEIANVFGFSRGVLEFNIVPAARAVPHVPWWALGLVAALLAAARPRRAWPASPAGRRLHRAACGLVLLVFATVLLSALLSPYKLVLNSSAFALCAAVLYADPLLRLWHRSGIMSLPYRTIATYLPHAAVMILVLWCIGQFERPGVGYTRLIIFGADFEATALPVVRRTPHDIEPGAGYDGQFYAQLALDPLLHDPAIPEAIDSPGYRGRRILFSWLAAAVGRGRPFDVLQAYALINVAAWVILAVLLLRWLPAGRIRTTFAWSACMMSDGLLMSIRASLPDGASMLLIALGVAALEGGRRWLAAATFGVAGLARETNVLGAVALVDESPRLPALRRLVLQGLLVAAPMALWIGYLAWRGFGGDAGIRNFDLPLVAWWEKWPGTIAMLQADGWRSFARFSLMSQIALATQFVYVAATPRPGHPWWRIGAVYACLFLVLGDAVWEGHPGAAGRVVLPMTVAFNILIPSSRAFWPLLLLGNLSILHGLEQLRVPGMYQ